MDLLEYLNHKKNEKASPLAARMRPRTLDEFIGQNAIVGEGRLLRRAIQADQISSLIFFGPPGTGKTTLAQIIANTTKAEFIALNAVLAGVKDIRESVKTAEQLRKDLGQRTILFIDEVHRFNKAQQDALLPWVENGTILFIGATTENPYFEVNKALVSRSRLFQLKSLQASDLHDVAKQALQDEERGYGQHRIQVDEDAMEHLVNIANGDARTLLNALELAIETTVPDEKGLIRIDLIVAEESIQKRALLYDKEGDAHFDTISAFIKSIRGSDPDASLYWLARMVYAGEDPRFIFRRLLIAASEDIGLADPKAVSVVEACAATFDRIGLPEGRFHLAQATLYLATAPKSNSVMGFFDALQNVKQEREAEVPNHIKDASRDKKGTGHGVGYLYPHAYRDHWVEQQYLPASLQGQVFYDPSDQGFEAGLRETVLRRREAQLAALLEGTGVAPPEILTYSPEDPKQERWLHRLQNQMGEQLSHTRDRLFSLATPQRHHVLLDLQAKSGLLTWEALRRVPEGGVFASIESEKDLQALQQQAKNLKEILRPTFLHTPLSQLAEHLQDNHPKQRFDRILGRNALLHQDNKSEVLLPFCELLAPEGLLILAETVSQQTQRLYHYLQPEWLEEALLERIKEAEEAIYSDAENPILNWQPEQLQQACKDAGFQTTLHLDKQETHITLTQRVQDRWFSTHPTKPTYAQRLQTHLSEDEIQQVQRLFKRHLLDKQVAWETTVMYLQVNSKD